MPGAVPPGEWADQVMLGTPRLHLDLAEPQDRLRLRNWLAAALESYLDAIEVELQRAAARGVAGLLVQARDPDYYEQRRASQRRPRVAEDELTDVNYGNAEYDELVTSGKIVPLSIQL